jgi:hypothetical protein
MLLIWNEVSAVACHVFWLYKIYPYFGEMCCFHLQHASASLKTYHREYITCHQVLQVALRLVFFVAIIQSKESIQLAFGKAMVEILPVSRSKAYLPLSKLWKWSYTCTYS